MTYTQINNEILDTPYKKGGLDGFELLVYIYALRQSETNEPVSVDIISEHYGFGEFEIREAFKTLIDRGMLEQDFEYDEKGNKQSYYTISKELKLAEVDEYEDEDMLVLSMDAPAPNCNNTPTKKDS